MKTRKITNNHYLVEDTARHFSADIKMNPRDAMVFANVLLLPEENQDAILTEFETYLKEQVGGKILLQLPQSVPQTHGEAKDMNAVKFITPDSLQSAHVASSDKAKLKNIDNQIASKAISFFDHPAQFTGGYEKLFTFKKANADFVTEQKIKNGLYSAIAEEVKITQNEFAHHFALYDDKTNQFIGCIQLCVHHNLGYLSDLIVGKEYRNQGYAQYLLASALTRLTELVDKDDHQQVEGAWLIEGGHDEGDPLIPVHHRLYDELLGAKPMTADLQRQLGVRLMFGVAKELLLNASNRDKEAPQESLDGKLSPAQAFARGLTSSGHALRTLSLTPAPVLNDVASKNEKEADIEQGYQVNAPQ